MNSDDANGTHRPLVKLPDNFTNDCSVPEIVEEDGIRSDHKIVVLRADGTGTVFVYTSALQPCMPHNVKLSCASLGLICLMDAEFFEQTSGKSLFFCTFKVLELDSGKVNFCLRTSGVSSFLLGGRILRTASARAENTPGQDRQEFCWINMYTFHELQEFDFALGYVRKIKVSCTGDRLFAMKHVQSTAPGQWTSCKLYTF
ncbi:hypothetical protein WJX73_007150 [Symbiochloris irregularis]|uniref:Uncharacterized protein n=1 Tax=Symbiochloris irregularis TaxID=706552 RepID=A0AAW1NQ40_9CHLO